MAAAVGFEFAIVAVTQQRVVVRIRFQVDAAAVAAVSAGGSAARHEFFAAERDAAVAAVCRPSRRFWLHRQTPWVTSALQDTTVRDRIALLDGTGFSLWVWSLQGLKPSQAEACATKNKGGSAVAEPPF